MIDVYRILGMTRRNYKARDKPLTFKPSEGIIFGYQQVIAIIHFLVSIPKRHCY